MKKKIPVIIGIWFALFFLSFSSLVYADLYAEKHQMWNEEGITPSIAYVGVSGDKEKLAEDYWLTRGAMGGVSDLNFIKEYDDGYTLEYEGKGITGSAGNNDYFFEGTLEKENLGSISFEFEQFRKFFDGTGGFYYPIQLDNLADPANYIETDRDLFLDMGNFKVEGVFAPEEGPKLTASYEREYRKGTESLLSWGTVTLPGPISPKILPTYLVTDEIVDKISLKGEDTIYGWDIYAEETWEQITINSQKCNNRTLNILTGAFSSIRYKYEDLDADNYTTIIRASKEFSKHIFYSFNFLYNYYLGHTQEIITDTGQTTTNENHPLNPARVGQNNVTLLNKLSVLLVDNLLMDIGVKWEWIKTSGKNTYDRDKGATPDGNRDEFLNGKTLISEYRIGESFNFRYDGLKDVALYADGEFEQQIRNVFEKQNSFGPQPTATNNFSRDSDVDMYSYEGKVGGKWYPIKQANVTAEFVYKYDLWDYDNASRRNQTGDVGNGYRGYLDNIAYTTYKPVIIFNVRPFNRLSCSFRYDLNNTRYGVRAPVAESTEISEYTANIYTFSGTVTPCDSLYFTGLFEMKKASTTTPSASSDGLVPTFNANVNTLSLSAGYSPFKSTTITGSYSFSMADNFDNFWTVGLPLGIDNLSQKASTGFQTKLTNYCSLDFKYDFMQYGEDSNGGVDNYMGHLFYTGLKMKF